MPTYYHLYFLLFLDPVGPGNVSITISVEYATDIPTSIASDFIDLIKNQTSGLQCFDSANCQTNIEIDQSTLTIVFNIPTSQGPDLDYSDYISSGIRKFYIWVCFMSIPGPGLIFWTRI
jgi:hypothetical protein